MEKKYTCCICNKESFGWGNNPWGAIDEQGRPVEWGDNDRCCTACNTKHVIPGRIYLMSQKNRNQIYKNKIYRLSFS